MTYVIMAVVWLSTAAVSVALIQKDRPYLAVFLILLLLLATKVEQK